jgi:uncharacterized membrane-anchored protein
MTAEAAPAAETRAIQRAAPEKRGFQARALEPSPSFWFAMLAASALGTNLGDFWADTLSLGLAASFASLAVIAALLIWGDRVMGRRTELFYWLAIVILRAVATNVGDFLTDDLSVKYIVSTLALGAATLVAGAFTVPVAPNDRSPRIDLRYWGAMFLGGAFGTVGGDMTSHGVGLFAATIALCAVLVIVITARGLIAPASIIGYWFIVLAERAAGTPAGDMLAEERGLGLGLPIAMVCTGALFLAGLLARLRGSGRTQASGQVSAQM